MAVLSWDEIRSRAMQFQNEWANESSENAESKTFWNEFFEIFGVSRRRIATFEERVKIEVCALHEFPLKIEKLCNCSQSFFKVLKKQFIKPRSGFSVNLQTHRVS